MSTLGATKLAAGYPPDSSRWSKERVIECIQNVHVKRTPLRDKPRQNRTWSKEKVIEAIREWHRTYQEIGPHPVSKLLRATARRYFGGFPQAMRAVGLEPRRRRAPRRKS